jgi:4-amino-4-deoxy-L-arabinose transferase-like glycosyltransferase
LKGRSLAALLAILGLFILVSVLLSIRREPWLDEGIFADPASNLAFKGVFGSTRWHTYIPQIVPDLPDIDRYTYWHMPLYLLSVSALFRVFGFSILAMRAWSIFWGCVLIVSWYVIVLTLLKGKQLAALLAAAFVAFDANIILSAVTGRPDTMLTALTALGMACYLRYRETRMDRAVFLCASFQALALFSHPVAVVHTTVALVMVLVLDWKNLRLRHLLPAAITPAILLLGWSFYIAQAPDVFRRQLFGHVSRRMSGLASPLTAIVMDFRYRYIHWFWDLYHGVTKLKVLYLAGYFGSLLFLLLAPGVRRRAPELRLLAVFGLTAYVVVAVIDNQMHPAYLIYTCSYFAACCGATIWWLMSESPRPALWASAAVALMALHLAGIGFKIAQNTTERSYAPLVRYIEHHSQPESFIVGPVELLFGLGLNSNLEDDPRLGMRSHRTPDMIVRSPFSASAGAIGKEEPLSGQFVSNRLNHEYIRTFKNEEYEVYLPASKAAGTN